MTYQYGILKQGLAFYPVVREKKWFSKGEWKKILKNGSRFELVPKDKLIYPSTRTKCLNIISDFKSWIITEIFIILET